MTGAAATMVLSNNNNPFAADSHQHNPSDDDGGNSGHSSPRQVVRLQDRRTRRSGACTPARSPEQVQKLSAVVPQPSVAEEEPATTTTKKEIPNSKTTRTASPTRRAVVSPTRRAAVSPTRRAASPSRKSRTGSPMRVMEPLPLETPSSPTGKAGEGTKVFLTSSPQGGRQRYMTRGGKQGSGKTMVNLVMAAPLTTLSTTEEACPDVAAVGKKKAKSSASTPPVQPTLPDMSSEQTHKEEKAKVAAEHPESNPSSSSPAPLSPTPPTTTKEKVTKLSSPSGRTRFMTRGEQKKTPAPVPAPVVVDNATTTKPSAAADEASSSTAPTEPSETTNATIQAASSLEAENHAATVVPSARALSPNRALSPSRKSEKVLLTKKSPSGGGRTRYMTRG